MPLLDKYTPSPLNELFFTVQVPICSFIPEYIQAEAATPIMVDDNLKAELHKVKMEKKQTEKVIFPSHISTILL